MTGRIEFVEPDDGDEPGQSSGPDASGPGSSGSGASGPDASGSGAAPVDEVISTPPPTRRRTAVVLALVAAVVLGLLVTRAVSSGGRHDDAAPTATTAPTASSSVADTGSPLGNMVAVLDANSGRIVASICPGDPVVPDGVPPAGLQSDAGGTLVEQNGARCTDDASSCAKDRPCAVTTEVPPAVLAAVHRRFPTARLALGRTETLRSTGRLWYRLLVFSLPHATTLRVDVVQRSATLQQAGERESGSGLFTRAVHANGDLVTLVTTGAPTGSTVRLGTQFALAADPELLTLP